MQAIKALAVCAAALASVAQGQIPSAASAPVLAPIAPAGQAVLRVGTEVPLRLSEGLTTKNKTLRTGQRFRLGVAEDVKVSGLTVIPVGSPAMGEITEVRNKGMWGKSGHFTAQLLYVQVNGRQIRLSGTFDDKGVTGTGAVVASALFVPVVGFFTTGTSASIPAGSSVKGFVDEDVPLSFAAATAPAPLVVSAAPAPLAVPAPAPAVAQPVVLTTVAPVPAK